MNKFTYIDPGVTAEELAKLNEANARKGSYDSQKVTEHKTVRQQTNAKEEK